MITLTYFLNLGDILCESFIPRITCVMMYKLNFRNITCLISNKFYKFTSYNIYKKIQIKVDIDSIVSILCKLEKNIFRKVGVDYG